MTDTGSSGPPDKLSPYLQHVYAVGLVNKIADAYLSGDRDKAAELTDIYVGEAAKDPQDAAALREDIHTAIMARALFNAIASGDNERTNQVLDEVMARNPAKVRTILAAMLFTYAVKSDGLPPEQHDQLMRLGLEAEVSDDLMEKFAALRREPG